jgi:GNAT superfamily N-acetyltransferase
MSASGGAEQARAGGRRLVDVVSFDRDCDHPAARLLRSGAVSGSFHPPRSLRYAASSEESIWHEDHSWVDDLAEERAADPEGLHIFVAEAGDLTVCAGWVSFPSGTEFVTFWGGATLPAWRRRGIYRALVAHRAMLAAEGGRRYIEVDASDDRRPILERLGFVAVTTTTPYVRSPPAIA